MRIDSIETIPNFFKWWHFLRKKKLWIDDSWFGKYRWVTDYNNSRYWFLQNLLYFKLEEYKYLVWNIQYKCNLNCRKIFCEIFRKLTIKYNCDRVSNQKWNWAKGSVKWPVRSPMYAFATFFYVDIFKCW